MADANAPLPATMRIWRHLPAAMFLLTACGPTDARRPCARWNHPCLGIEERLASTVWGKLHQVARLDD